MCNDCPTSARQTLPPSRIAPAERVMRSGRRSNESATQPVELDDALGG